MDRLAFTVPGEAECGDRRFLPVAVRLQQGRNIGCVQPKRPAIERLRERCERQGACLVWTGSVDLKGYGRFRDDGGRRVQTHRFAYEAFVGPIPPGLTIDHLCRNTSCCEPSRLEPVTNAENIRRGTQGGYQRKKTHCANGHPYAGDNLYVNPRGERSCRTCQRANGRRRAKQLREARRG